MAIKSVKVAADFETTVDPNDCRVWAACAVDIKSLETVHISNSIESFFEWLQDKNSTCYFHNLKFDGEFIISYLLRNGYEQIDPLLSPEEKAKARKPKTFETLISDQGAWYSITVIFDKLNKKYKKVVFYDSLKKLPFKVATISKAFQLEDEKLEIDYKTYRAPGHELTEEEKRYIVNDCRIVAAALNIQFSKGLKKMTNASDALSGYKDIIERQNFESRFPVLPVELDADIRLAYKGGFTYLNPKHKGARGLQGITLDVNSLYPSVMYNCALPYGYPMFFEGEPPVNEKYNLFIVRLECAFDLKPDHIPTIQLKNNRGFIPTEYLTTTNGDIIELTFTSVDLKLFLDHYDTHGTLRYINGWMFRSATGMFKEYIDYWMHIKETETGALRQLAKLMLNSLYGKFATNPRSYERKARLDPDNVVRYDIINERYCREHKLPPPEPRDPVYTAMGAFITAYAREKTIRSAQSVYDRFIYADTDSLHLIDFDIPEGIEVHPTKLGAWKHEGTFTDSKYIRAKTYMETIDGVNKVTCAGMPDNVKEQVTYENFTDGAVFSGKLMPRRCVGGVVLVETTFTIS